MADVNLSHLDGDLASAYMEWVTRCAAAFLQNGLSGTVRIIQGFRDPAYQDELKSSGVSHLGGRESLHCWIVDGKPASRAFDFGVFEADGSYVTDGNDQRYAVAGEAAESLGLVWGGRFVHPAPDPDHIQLADLA